MTGYAFDPVEFREWMLGLLQIGATAGAVWAGLSFTLKTYREQKSIDRRLDWYERAVRALIQVSVDSREFVAAVRYAARRKSDLAEDPDWRSHVPREGPHAFLESATKLTPLLVEAQLFATQAGYDGIRECIRLLNEVGSGHDAGTATPQLEIEWAENVGRVALLTAGTLSGDIRAELRLPALVNVQALPAQESPSNAPRP